MRIKRYTQFLMIILLLILSIPFIQSATSENEPNDSKYTAESIFPGDTVTGMLDASSDPADYYKFRMCNGDRMAATLTGPSGDFDLWLFGYDYDIGITDMDVSSYIGTSNEEVSWQQLLVGGTYYLGVWADEGYGSYSLSLTITNPYTIPENPPEPFSPKNNSVVLDNTPTLYWDGFNHNGFQVQVDDAVSFTSPLVNQKTIGSEKKSIYEPIAYYWTHPVIESLDMGTYYWRIRIIKGTSYGPWSQAWSFTVRTVSIQKPLDGSTLTDTTPELAWSNVPGLTDYSVQIHTSNQFYDPLLEAHVFQGSNLSVTAFLPDRTYYWRIRTLNFDNEEDWSPVWSFNIRGLQTPPSDTLTIQDALADGYIDLSITGIYRGAASAFNFRAFNVSYGQCLSILVTSYSSVTLNLNWDAGTVLVSDKLLTTRMILTENLVFTVPSSGNVSATICAMSLDADKTYPTSSDSFSCSQTLAEEPLLNVVAEISGCDSQNAAGQCAVLALDNLTKEQLLNMGATEQEIKEAQNILNAAHADIYLVKGPDYGIIGLVLISIVALVLIIIGVKRNQDVARRKEVPPPIKLKAQTEGHQLSNNISRKNVAIPIVYDRPKEPEKEAANQRVAAPMITLVIFAILMNFISTKS